MKVLGISREEAPSSHTQAVVDTQRAAPIENESTGREIMDERLFFYVESHAGGVSGLTVKIKVM